MLSKCEVQIESRNRRWSHRCWRASGPSQILQCWGWPDIGTQQRAAKGGREEREGGVYLIK